MKIEFARVDERLIHGQVMTSWVKLHSIKRIILVDDDIAKDEFAIQVLLFSAPIGVDVQVKSVLSAIKSLESDDFDGNVMLLFKGVRYANELVKLGYRMKRLNIGNMGSAPGRKAITRKVYVSEEEKAMIRNMINQGVDIYIQELAMDQEVNVVDKI